MKIDLKSILIRLLEDRSGAVTVTAAVWLGVAGVALAGLGIDGANLYRVKGALQQSSNQAALAGAEQLAKSLSAATSTAKQYSSDTAAQGVNSINGVQSVTATVATSCVWSLLPGDPTSAIACPGTGANVVTVTQTAIVNTFFNLGTKTITATSVATANGGGGGLTGNLDVILIIDSTGSMSNCETGSCSASTNPFKAPIACPPPAPSAMSKMQAAELAVQTLLCSFTPANGTTGTQVALMTFPGINYGKNTVSIDYCGSTTTDSNWSTVAYNTVTNAQYLIVPFSNDFRTSAAATTLNTSSPMVQAMGGGLSKGLACRGLYNKAGQGTYYGGVLAAANAYFASNGRATAQKVIFLLSDGDANASSGPSTNQCQVAVANADTASAAGAWVFAVAYNALTGNNTCSTDKTGPYVNNACKAMQNVASSSGKQDLSKFFAYNGANSGANCTANNVSLPTLAATFKAALESFTAARLINGNCATVETCNL
jgi:Putative Flp pilus-assembly TadE/G-like